MIFGEGLAQLLRDPGSGGIVGDIEVQYFAPVVRDYEKAVQYAEGPGGQGEKVLATIASPWFLRR